VVARRDRRVVGYLISEVQRGRGHIVSMAVATNYKRTGIGKAMLRGSIDRFTGRIKQVYLEVVLRTRPPSFCVTNSYEETSKVRKKYYPDGEDAIEMKRSV
jgi:hypothetical protein